MAAGPLPPAKLAPATLRGAVSGGLAPTAPALAAPPVGANDAARAGQGEGGVSMGLPPYPHRSTPWMNNLWQLGGLKG